MLLGEKEKEQVLDLLESDNGVGNISVVSIVGIGGVGKTTLAQLIYNGERVDQHFDLKLWICVSDDFTLLRLLKSILESVTDGEQKCEILDLDNLQRRVRKVLARNRFLLVLDDVWNEEQGKWENLEIFLRSGAHGSKIIVTTRSEKVSMIMESTAKLQLQPLSYDLCWDLFGRRAFGVGAPQRENLVVIGKNIVKKCGGLPLVAKALGSLMRFKLEEADWKLVLESETWQILDGDVTVMPALKLSYDHLSTQSKRCFALCSLFPKDHEMDKVTLVHQWMCNGFVQNELVGLEIFNDLVWRSFLLEAKKDSNGQVLKCKIHDLMHDLARYVATRHFCILAADIGNENIYRSTHHLLVDKFPTLLMLDTLKKIKSLRTFLLSECDNPFNNGIVQKMLVHLRYVRVLDLSSNGIKCLRNSLGSLIHLRYLNLSYNPLENLPKSIGHLLNLQILKLLHTHLIKLPKCLTNIRNLRHLDIRSCRFLTTMPIGLGKLTDLITLTDFIVSKKKYSCGLEEVKDLKISGELFIWHLENFKTRNGDNKQELLINKENLHTLRLTWDHHNSTLISNNDHEGTLDSLRPHPKLKILQVHSYGGLKFPPWIATNPIFPSLTEVKLTYCTKCEHLPPFGSIPSLKILEIIGMHEVKQIGVEFYGTGSTTGFLKLEILSFYEMPKFKEWSTLEGIQLFPHMTVLTIGKCPLLNSIPWFPSIQNLVLSKCSALLMEFLPNLTTLSSLVMEDIKELASLPIGSLSNFNSLRKLHISNCVQLENLPLNDLERLSSLQSLEITGCPKLASLSFDSSYLTSLRFMNLSFCSILDSLPKNLARIMTLESLNVIGSRNIISWNEQEINGLSILKDFSIEICNKKSVLSGWLLGLTNLTTLIIYGGHPNSHHVPNTLISGNSLKICCCDQLDSLFNGLSMASSLEQLTLDGILGSSMPNSIGEIKSLKHLEIYRCAELESLPGSIRGLDILGGLFIRECPELERRCQRNIGEDWNIISHVSIVSIGGKIITDNNQTML